MSHAYAPDSTNRATGAVKSIDSLLSLSEFDRRYVEIVHSLYIIVYVKLPPWIGTELVGSDLDKFGTKIASKCE